MKHTEGPWTPLPNNSWGEYHKLNFGEREGFVVCHTERGQSAAIASVIGMPFRSQQEIDANAKLIAAAPDMLNSLLEAKKAWETLAEATGEEGLLPEDTAYQSILNAIKKATL